MFVALLCLLGQCPLYAQIISSLTVDDGLSQGYVPSIACDKDGFVWIATLNGLNRYDGHSFMVWNEQEGGLSSNHINTIKYDSRGVLWMSTNNGLEVMDCKTGLITRIKCMDGLVNHQFDAVMIDRKGMLWLTYQKELYCLSIPSVWISVAEISQKAILQKIQLSPEVGNLHAILDYKNTILLSTSNGTFTYDPLTKNVRRFTKVSSGYTYGAWYDTIRLQLLVRFKDRLEVLEHEKVQVFPLEQPIWNHDYCIIEDGGKVFVLTSFKVYEWKDGKLVLTGELDVEIVSGAVDRVGHIWLGTNAKGIKVIKTQESIFTTLMHGVSIGGALFDKDDQIWLPKQQNFKESLFNLLNKETGKPGRQLIAQPRQSVTLGAEGHIWALSTSDQLEMFTMDGAPVKSSIIQIPPGTFRGEARNIFNVGPTHIIAVADHSGTLLFVDPREKAIIAVNHLSFLNGISGEIKSLVTDRNDRCWLGTLAGLICLSPYDTSVHVIHASGEVGKVLSSEKVNEVFIDPREPDEIWIGTARGLNRLDIKTGNIVAYTKKDGLNDDFIYTILAGKPGELWLGTNHGLLCFNRYTKQVVQYTVADGLPASEFNTGMAWQGKDSTLYFGTVAGVVYFNPYKIPAQQINPDIRLTGLEINGTSFAPSGREITMIPFLDHVILEPQENNIAFRFTVMDFFNAEKYNCRYMLINVDKDWRYTWSNNLITYSNLSPGDYTFVVSAGDGAGGWSESRRLQITVLAPWWNRWWAWLVWIILMIASAGVIYRIYYRMEGMKRQMEISKMEARYRTDLEEHKTRMFVNISHEIRTPLTILMGLTDEIHKEAGSPLDTKTNLMQQTAHQLLNVVQQVNDLVKLDEKRLELNWQYGDLSAFMQFILNPFKSMFRGRQIELMVMMPDQPVMMMFDPQYMQPVISNLLSNAFKFTAQGGTVKFHLWCESAVEVRFAVTDNGIGIAPEYLSAIFDRYFQIENEQTTTAGTGIGLTYVSELVKLMGGQITVQSTLGVGSVFTVVLPVRDRNIAQKDDIARSTLIPELNRDVEATTIITRDETVDKPYVLLVEDNYEMVQYIQQSLSDHFVVSHAINGLEGLRMATDRVPDLIITDVMMPEMNGLEFCAAIKNNVVTNHIPVVVLTALAEDTDRVRGLQNGADIYLSKPFSPTILRLHLTNLIASRNRMQSKMQSAVLENKTSDADGPEQVFLKEINRVISLYYTNTEFGVDDLSREFRMSTSQFHRKISAMLGSTPGQLIRDYRLECGRQLLLEKPGLAVAQVGYASGFSDPNYFSHAFAVAFGKSPREYRKLYTEGL